MWTGTLANDVFAGTASKFMTSRDQTLAPGFRGGPPPVVMGQVYNYVGSPNRYGIPAFYELHVWTGKANPDGPFADWHPHVSCDKYLPQE